VDFFITKAMFIPTAGRNLMKMANTFEMSGLNMKVISSFPPSQNSRKSNRHYKIHCEGKMMYSKNLHLFFKSNNLKHCL